MFLFEGVAILRVSVGNGFVFAFFTKSEKAVRIRRVVRGTGLVFNLVLSCATFYFSFKNVNSFLGSCLLSQNPVINNWLLFTL